MKHGKWEGRKGGKELITCGQHNVSERVRKEIRKKGKEQRKQRKKKASKQKKDGRNAPRKKK